MFTATLRGDKVFKAARELFGVALFGFSVAVNTDALIISSLLLSQFCFHRNTTESGMSSRHKAFE
jgi:hypothetical protein